MKERLSAFSVIQLLLKCFQCHRQIRHGGEEWPVVPVIYVLSVT